MIDGRGKGCHGAATPNPILQFNHADADVRIKLVHNARSDHWVLSIPVPAAAIATTPIPC